MTVNLQEWQIPLVLPLTCDMLVDQDAYIGSDPVGYKCSRPARYKAESGHLLCAECRTIFRFAPHRLTFPPTGFGEEYQKALIKDLVESHVLRLAKELRPVKEAL